MLTYPLHPTARFMIGFLCLIAVQFLGAWPLFAVALLPPLFGRRALGRGMRLAWRARYLLITLLLIFSWGMPGQAIEASFWHPLPAPTYEGVHEAWLHLGRLCLIMMIVALLLETTPLPESVSALRSLLFPLTFLGVDLDRGVIRLLLVLHYVETLPRPRDWKMLLTTPTVVTQETFELQQRAWRGFDYAVLSLASLMLGWIAFF